MGCIRLLTDWPCLTKGLERIMIGMKLPMFVMLLGLFLGLGIEGTYAQSPPARAKRSSSLVTQLPMVLAWIKTSPTQPFWSPC